MFKLIIEGDEGKTTVVPLIRDEITIGRREGNTIRLTERNISRRHARLVKSNGHVLIEDLQSYNGIKVNGDRIGGRAPIQEGDRIQIGDYQLALKIDKSATSPAPAASSHTTDPAIESVPPAPGSTERTMAMPRPDTGARALAPTVPLTPVTETPARLVIVSSNFPGKTFIVDKPRVVMGRASDCDVMIDHRSISRQHALITRDGTRYHVEDLGSQNGVRVNGEDYGKVELRRGDHIDLGHVRLRFIAPGEDFVFERDAKIVDVEGEGGGRGKAGLIVGVIGAMVAVVAVVAVVRMLGSSDAPGASASAESGDVGGQVARLSLEIDERMKAEDWSGAIAKAGEGLALNPKQETLRDKKAQAELEKKAQGIHAEYTQAVQDGELSRAVSLFGDLPEKSIYRGKSQAGFASVRASYVKQHLDSARSLGAASRCDEARKHVEAVLFVDDANAEALDVAKRCAAARPQALAARPEPRPEVAVARPAAPEPAPTPRAPKEPAVAATPREPREPKPVARPEPKAEPKPAPVVKAEPKAEPREEGVNVEALVNEAQDDYVHGKYESAIEKARRANKAAGGNNAKAWRIIGASSCFLKDKTGAVASWNRLSAMDRQFLKYVCQRNTITIP